MQMDIDGEFKKGYRRVLGSLDTDRVLLSYTHHSNIEVPHETELQHSIGDDDPDNDTDADQQIIKPYLNTISTKIGLIAYNLSINN